MEIEALLLEELPDGSMRLVAADGLTIGLYRCHGELHAIEDRCSHDDGPLCEGERDGFCVVCPRHGARFDLRTGAVLSLPATEDVEAFEVVVRDGEAFVVA